MESGHLIIDLGDALAMESSFPNMCERVGFNYTKGD